MQVREKLAPFASKPAIVFASVVLVVLLVSSVFLGREVLRQLHDLSVATTDNVQWNLSQGEVEHLRLQAAVHQAEDGGSLEPIRRTFNIFYSRVVILHESPLFEVVRTSGEGELTLARIQGRLDALIPLIDGPDQALRSALGDVVAKLEENVRDVRGLTLLGVAVHSQQADAKRQGMVDTLRLLGWVALALLAALILTGLMLGRQYHNGQMLTAASNASAARMKAMVTSSLDAILVLDTKGTIISFNGAAETVFGYSKDEALGQSMVDLIVPDHLRSQHLKAFERYLKTGKATFLDQGRLQLEAKRKSGEVFPVELSVALSHSGEDIVFVSFLRDISDRIEAEAQLTRARDEALAGARAKENLLTVISHEMRTPLSGVLGSLELLDASGVTTEQHSYLHAMRVSGELLLHHVNEVLELSKLEAGAVSEQSRSFDLEDLMRGLIDSQKAHAQINGNTIELYCELDGEVNVLGRPHQVQQIILNLIGNALKFTNNGLVTVQVKRLMSGPEVEFLVSDTGEGIAVGDLERIFEDFVTLDPSYGRTSEGTGLGLAIMRRIVDSLGGKIEAESERGKGSQFRVSLPLPVAKMDQKNISNQLAETASAKRILVAEDNDINRLLLAKMLERLGHQVVAAEGGAEVVQAAAEGQFDLILMDISMPEVDGIEASRRIREQKLAEGVEIVALTAHAAADDHARILGTGFAEVVTKPISRFELGKLVTRHAGASLPRDADKSDIHQFTEALGAERALGFLGTFCADVNSFLNELKMVSSATNKQRDEAHRLAGSAAILGLGALRRSLLEIEESEEGTPLSVAPLMKAWAEAEQELKVHGVSAES